MNVRAAVLVVSGAVARGEAEDRAGALLAERLSETGAQVVDREVVGDDAEAIERSLRGLIEGPAQAVLTVGGTGLTVDDVTPQATRAVLDRDAPGIAEALRAESVRRKPAGMLTRGLAGVAGRTLVVNLPGSAHAVQELFPVLAEVLEHAVALVESPGGSRRLHRRD